MALSYTLDPVAMSSKPRARKQRRVLVTGAAGNIGSYFAEHSDKHYDLRLMVRSADDAKQIEKHGDIVVGELADIERLKAFCEGIDTVLHLAAQASPNATWDELLQANIIGSYNVYVAARAAKCRRVIYASSIHAISGHPADMQVKSSDPVNPGDLYGVSKCFGEAMGRYMAEQEKLSVIALRIGAFQPREAAREESGVSMFDAWVSQRDLNQLIERCIDDETLRFAIFNGLSDNRFKRMDITDARELLGYSPQDDFTEENEKLRKLNLSEEVGPHNQSDGGKSGIREELKQLTNS